MTNTIVVLATLLLISHSARADTVPKSLWLERFQFPPNTSVAGIGWIGGQEIDGRKDHYLVKEGEKTFMRSSYIPHSEAKYIYKEIDWDTNEYPYLRWSWRAHKFPKNAAILDSSRSDAAAQVYVLWKVRTRKYVIKYFWATSDKVGEELHQSNFIIGKLFGTVIRSGGTANEWHTETRHVREDFLKGFGAYPTEHALGIAILSDADETKSESEADYSDFEVLKKPE